MELDELQQIRETSIAVYVDEGFGFQLRLGDERVVNVERLVDVDLSIKMKFVWP